MLSQKQSSGREKPSTVKDAEKNLRTKFSAGSEVAASFMLPHLFPPRRYASQFSAAPTAVASPYLVANSDWTVGSNDVGASVPNGMSVVIATRNPLAAFISWTLNPGFKVAEYGAKFCGLPISFNFVDSQPITLSTAHLEELLVPQRFDDLHAADSVYFHPHGPRFYTFDVGGRKGVYLDTTLSHQTNVVATVTSGSASAGARLNVWVFTLGSWVMQSSSTFSAGNTTGIIYTPGLYTFTYSDTVAGAVGISLRFRLTCDCMAFAPIPHVDEFGGDLEGIRVNALSLMMTPHPAQLYEGGEVVGVQLPTGTDWIGMLGSRSWWDATSQMQEALVLPFKNGLFGFHRPDDVNNFTLQRPFVIENENVVAINNPWFPNGGCMMIVASVGNIAGAYPSGVAHITAAWNVEFRTTNVWFVMSPPQITVEQFEEAMRTVAKTQQWHENPLHVKEIMRSLAQKAQTLLKLTPEILKVLSMLFPGMAIPGSLSRIAHGIGAAF